MYFPRGNGESRELAKPKQVERLTGTIDTYARAPADKRLAHLALAFANSQVF